MFVNNQNNKFMSVWSAYAQNLVSLCTKYSLINTLPTKFYPLNSDMSVIKQTIGCCNDAAVCFNVCTVCSGSTLECFNMCLNIFNLSQSTNQINWFSALMVPSCVSFGVLLCRGMSIF